ncbi:putative pentatricopeptide repeat-containing protein At5g40405 [Macadamia integrifolia]|uniref:putative pentatricopeptide repeat-containing protein At5g40405 n=1 Tax=Macadamia integrifolia TaxID=60698 RepID=UPI001C4EF028|nr:putative pentatricopeptide repeat-containing protein At5g40405 [Macadamia integrifolia]
MSSLRCITKHPTISLVESCSGLQEIRQIHTQLLINGLLNDPFFFAQFLASIALHHPQNVGYSQQLLDQSHNPTVFALNSMIRAHSKGPNPERSFHFFHRILSSNLSPDNYTFTFLVRTCARVSLPKTSLAVHASLIKHGFELEPHIQSGLINSYAELGFLDSSRRLFSGIYEPDLVTRTAMLSACARCGEVDFAQKLFDEIPYRDPISWNAMIAGYAQCGRSREALHLFHLMQKEGVEVSEATMVSVLSACSHLGALDQGRWAHIYIERNRLRLTVTLGTALIDMYSKCGNMGRAMNVFWEMREKNVYTWSAAIGGLAMNGAGEECLKLFDLMKQECVLPNEVTFIAVLRGCSVVGLVEKGRKHFDSMIQVYGLEPELEHYGCMADLYGRAGHLDDAFDFISNMPMKPHAGAWGALLNACRIHRNMELGELALSKILELEDKNHGAYVQLSNMYADSRDWDRVSNVRQLMKAKGVRKIPGCSVIEVGGEVHEFFVGDKSHLRYGEIEVMLGEISRRLRLSGYVANTNPVLFDIEEEDKEDALCRHSEKVAIAFGLISLGEGVPIRIVKNLRVCGDCHDATKIISRVFNREIIVRDRNRFHHFKDGECSCKGFW